MLLYLYQSPMFEWIADEFSSQQKHHHFFIETNIKIVPPKHAKAHHLRMLRAQNDEMIKSQHSKWKSRPAIAKYLTEHVSNHTHDLVVKFHLSLFIVFLVGLCPRSGWANQEHELLERSYSPIPTNASWSSFIGPVGGTGRPLGQSLAHCCRRPLKPNAVGGCDSF